MEEISSLLIDPFLSVFTFALARLSNHCIYASDFERFLFFLASSALCCGFTIFTTSVSVSFGRKDMTFPVASVPATRTSSFLPSSVSFSSECEPTNRHFHPELHTPFAFHTGHSPSPKVFRFSRFPTKRYFLRSCSNLHFSPY